jgi:hypothetical protein
LPKALLQGIDDIRIHVGATSAITLEFRRRLGAAMGVDIRNALEALKKG